MARTPYLIALLILVDDGKCVDNVLAIDLPFHTGKRCSARWQFGW
jgi:hypothetical protein